MTSGGVIASLAMTLAIMVFISLGCKNYIKISSVQVSFLTNFKYKKRVQVETCTPLGLFQLFFGEGDGLFEDGQTFVHLRLGDAERRGDADHAVPAAEQEQAALKG